MSRRGNAIVGLVAVLALIAAAYGLSLYLGGNFKPGFEVTAHFARAGQLLRDGSDVKTRGVLVGAVKTIEISESGTATVVMRIFPGERISDEVGAAIRAKTLFGEKYIDLIQPTERRGSGVLEPGDDIPLDRTIPPIEVETILEKAVPILGAVDPEQFGGALHALAEGFVGNEEALRNATVQGEKTLTETERTLPNFERNLVHLRRFADALDASDDSLVSTLDGLEKAGRAIVRHRGAVDKTLDQLPGITKDLADIVVARERDLGDLAGKQDDILKIVADKEKDLPAILDVLDGFLGVWVMDLSQGPYWRIVLDLAPATVAPYPPGTEPRPRGAAARPALAQLAAEGVNPAVAGTYLAAVPEKAMPTIVGRLKQLLEGEPR